MKKFINKIMEYWGKKDIIEQLIWITAISLLVVAASFSGYYYWDRYVALNDSSPAEMAIDELEKQIRENPDDIQLRMMLTEKYYQTGQYQSCIEQSYMIIEQYGDTYDGAYFLAGMSYLMLGDQEEGIPVLERFVELRSALPMAQIDDVLQTAYYYLGITYYDRAEYDLAIPYLEKALEVNHTDADSMYKLGQAFAGTGQHELALEQYHEAVRFVPDYHEAYQGMIDSYTVLNLSDKVSYARGMQLFVEKDYQTAIVHLYSSYETDPDFVPNLLGLGLVYEQLGDYDVALLYINKVLQLDPNNFMANNVVGRIQQLIQEEDK